MSSQGFVMVGFKVMSQCLYGGSRVNYAKRDSG